MAVTNPFEDAEELSGLAVLAMPWVFTQHYPLDPSDFVTEAEARGIRLDEPTLRELYRRRLLIPLAHFTPRRQAQETPNGFEPAFVTTPVTAVRYALRTRHLVDPASAPYQRGLRFTGYWPSDSRHWPLFPFYSRFQLLGLEALRDLLATRRWSYSRGRMRAFLPPPDKSYVTASVRYRRLALILTALEGRCWRRN